MGPKLLVGEEPFHIHPAQRSFYAQRGRLQRGYWACPHDSQLDLGSSLCPTVLSLRVRGVSPRWEGTVRHATLLDTCTQVSRHTARTLWFWMLRAPVAFVLLVSFEVHQVKSRIRQFLSWLNGRAVGEGGSCKSGEGSNSSYSLSVSLHWTLHYLVWSPVRQDD